MTNHDYIPAPDAQFDIWQDQFMTGVTPNIPLWKIDPADFATLTPLKTAWSHTWLIAKDKGTRSSAETVAKDEARTAYEHALRAFVKQWITGNLLVTDDQRRDIGVTVPDRERTPVGVKRNAPMVSFDPSIHLVKTLRFGNPDDPHTQSMPAGQKILLERFIGEKGLDPSAITFGNAQIVTRFLHTVQYSEADVGKWAYVRACYVNTKGEQGPFSAVASEVVM